MENKMQCLNRAFFALKEANLYAQQEIEKNKSHCEQLTSALNFFQKKRMLQFGVNKNDKRGYTI